MLVSTTPSFFCSPPSSVLDGLFVITTVALGSLCFLKGISDYLQRMGFSSFSIFSSVGTLSYPLIATFFAIGSSLFFLDIVSILSWIRQKEPLKKSISTPFEKLKKEFFASAIFKEELDLALKTCKPKEYWTLRSEDLLVLILFFENSYEIKCFESPLKAVECLKTHQQLGYTNGKQRLPELTKAEKLEVNQKEEVRRHSHFITAQLLPNEYWYIPIASCFLVFSKKLALEATCSYFRKQEGASGEIEKLQNRGLTCGRQRWSNTPLTESETRKLKELATENYLNSHLEKMPLDSFALIPFANFYILLLRIYEKKGLLKGEYEVLKPDSEILARRVKKLKKEGFEEILIN